MKPEQYSKIMAENGRKGGLAKGENYSKYRVKVITYFINTNFTQNKIADVVGVSQAFVSKYTNDNYLKQVRLQNTYTEEKEIKLKNLLLNLQIDKLFNEKTPVVEIVRRMKI